MSTKSTSSAASDDDTSGGERAISNVVSGEMNICDVSQLATETSSHTASDADAHHPDLQHTASQEDDDNMNEAYDASSKYIVHRLKELYHNDIVGAEKDYHLHFNFCLPVSISMMRFAMLVYIIYCHLNYLFLVSISLMYRVELQHCHRRMIHNQF